MLLKDTIEVNRYKCDNCPVEYVTDVGEHEIPKGWTAISAPDRVHHYHNAKCATLGVSNCIGYFGLK